MSSKDALLSQANEQHRKTYVDIDLAALKHNAERVKEFVGGSTKIMSVIKANAYGHGMLEVAEALMGVSDELAVASMDAALLLRKQLLSNSQDLGITVLSGFHSAKEIELSEQNEISLVVYDHHQVDLLEGSSVSGELNLWLKLDTGMSRLGFAAEELDLVIHKIETLSNVHIRGVISHFACADEPENDANQKQLTSFAEAKKKYSDKNWQWSMANSAGLTGIKGSHNDWVRPGIMLYGSSPLKDQSAESLGLLPVMTLSSEIISIRSVNQGESVGYGGTWQAQQETKVAVIACGYGDGYPRHIAANTPVLVNGQRSKILGRVSMDLIVVDLSEVPAKVGDVVTLWGKGLPIDEVAASAETIAYELMCGVTQRVSRRYIK